jgi:Cu/Ag efflux pump CusA
MRGIISSSLRFRTLVVAAAAILCGFGAWQLRNAPLDTVPEFSPLVLTVKTEALGLSSAEVEALVTIPIEADLLNGVPWLRSIDSTSMTGVSTVNMLFAPGTDVMHARQMVQERLTQAHALPNVSSPPVLLQPVSSASRIMNIGLSSDTVSLIEMTVQAHWNIVPRLVGVPGVANVSIWGRRDRQLQVQVAPDALHARGVTMEQVIKTAGEAVFASPLTFLNSSTPGTGGFIDTPNQRLSIRHVSPLVTPEHLARIPVVESPLTLGQIASVVEGHQPLIGDAIVKGETGVMLVVEKFPGYNTQEVTRGIEKALVEMRPGLPGIEIDTGIYRSASFIERATSNLATALAIACALLVLCMLALLRGWRAALVGIIAVPVSLLAGWLVLHLRGFGLSMIALAGLLLALGVVIHDAILGVDGVVRRLREGGDRSAFRAVVAGSQETRRPMVFATLILLLAVAPMLLAEGQLAALVRPLAWTYVAAILASMLVAVTVTPALAAMLLAGAPAAKPSEAKPAATGLVGKMQAHFDRKVEPALRSPMPAFGLAAVAVFATVLAWARFDRDLLPTFKETDVLVEWRGPEGIALPEMSRTTKNLIKDLRALPGVRNAAAHIGRAVLCNCDDAEDVNAAEVWVSIDPRADYGATLASIRTAVAEYPGMTGEVSTYLSKKVRQAATDHSDRLTVRLYGHDPNVLRTKAEEVRNALGQVRGIANPRVEALANEATIEVEVDLERASAHGFKPGDVRRATSSLVGGITVGALFEQQKVFDVVVWGAPDVRKNVADIQNIQLETDNGTPVRLSEVANVRLVPANSVIRRHGASQRLDVLADVDGRPVGAVAQEVSERLKKVSFPLEYHARVLGDFDGGGVTRSVEGYAIAAAVLSFLLLQAAFGSWRLAAVFLVALPVVVLGSLVAVVLDGVVISLGSVLGCAAALGLTLRIGMAMVGRFQGLERDGMPHGEDLVRRGLRESLPATVATLVTTGVVTLPFLALGGSAGLEIAHPMAVAIIGGLVGSAVATLVLTPALYLRFATGAAADPLELESVPEPEPSLR